MADVDDLLQMFSRISTDDHGTLVAQFCKVLQTDNQTSTFFLESSNWNVEMAINNFLATVGFSGGIVATATPEATFIGDISIVQQQQAFPVGSTIEMVWSFSNSGPAAWPSDTQLFFADGNRMGIPNVPVFAQPGQQISIPVTLRVPDSPGTYAATWRLGCSAGVFGEPLWIIVSAAAVEPGMDALTAAMSGMRGAPPPQQQQLQQQQQQQQQPTGMMGMQSFQVANMATELSNLRGTEMDVDGGEAADDDDMEL